MHKNQLVKSKRHDDEVMPGIRYGREDQLLSPAYWAMKCATADVDQVNFVNRHGTLEEEVGFCLLGGYSVTLEVAAAFFDRLKRYGVFRLENSHSEADIMKLLQLPALVNGRPCRYRFPNQRAKRIRGAMVGLKELDLNPEHPIEFRNQLQRLEGVGPKTASWIARNWLDSDQIAILDIHVLRAGWFLGLFDRSCRLPSDYLNLERLFLEFAEKLEVRASVLDCVMWLDMRTFGSKLIGSVEIG